MVVYLKRNQMKHWLDSFQQNDNWELSNANEGKFAQLSLIFTLLDHWIMTFVYINHVPGHQRKAECKALSFRQFY